MRLRASLNPTDSQAWRIGGDWIIVTILENLKVVVRRQFTLFRSGRCRGAAAAGTSKADFVVDETT